MHKFACEHHDQENTKKEEDSLMFNWRLTEITSEVDELEAIFNQWYNYGTFFFLFCDV